jgi:hypothetical protein
VSKRFAERLHTLFLRDIRGGTCARWKFPAETLADYRRFSINVICWFGRDMRGVPELAIRNLFVSRVLHPIHGEEVFDEESMLSEYLPAQTRRPNVICGDALFSHFAFHPQRRYLERVTALLEDYRELIIPGRTPQGALHRRVRRASKMLASLGSLTAWSFLLRKLGSNSHTPTWVEDQRRRLAQHAPGKDRDH